MKKKARFHEPSLVPLADMLTNTVGIVVFILIFTVLTAGGAVVTKRLPMERTSDTKPLTFLCTKGRLLPLPIVNDAFVDSFVEPLGGWPKSYKAVKRWVEEFNARTVESEYFIAKGDGESHFSETALGAKSVSVSLTIAFTPRTGAGDTIGDLDRSTSALRQALVKHSSSERFAYFIVANDGIEVFAKAREIVTTQLGYGYGWTPTKHDQPVLVGIGGGGGYTPSPQ